MGLNLNLNINGAKRRSILPPVAPTSFTSVFTVDTITGDLAWTDNSGGSAAYEIYSNTNEEGDVLLTTTAAGATSYGDTTCKQNASVVYTVRAKKGTIFSTYATATALVTPLCWKTNQTTRTGVVINNLSIAAGKTVVITWGDGGTTSVTGNNTNITHTYAASATNIFNISMNGDLNSITVFYHFTQVKSYGNITNWTKFNLIVGLRLYGNAFTGDDVNNEIPASCSVVLMRLNALTGKLPNMITGSGGMIYDYSGNNITGSNLTVFKAGMTLFDISDQNSVFPTAEIDNLLLRLANWYQVNAPTDNCTFDMSGANMGIPTGGASNVDLVRLVGYYTAQSKTATVVIRTS